MSRVSTAILGLSFLTISATSQAQAQYQDQTEPQAEAQAQVKAQAQQAQEPAQEESQEATADEAPVKSTEAATATKKEASAVPSPQVDNKDKEAKVFAQSSLLNSFGAPLALSLHAEIGFLAPVAHSIQFGRQGTNFDYIGQGGQDNLFPFTRISAEGEFAKHHHIVLLYQPLQVATQVKLRDELILDDVSFAAGTPMNLLYGFDFWRLSYLYDFDPSRNGELSIGASLQIRNATIGFSSHDGNHARYTRDIGPVPIIKVRGRTDLNQNFWVGAEADGFYAPIKYLNGGTTDVVGAIADVSVRSGMYLSSGAEAFVGLRYLGGGATGTSQSDPNPGDNYVDNWLNFVSLTLGLSLR